MVHDNELLICSMCGIDIQGATALQEHMKEHFVYSVPCIYCDKYFLNKKCKDDHVKEYHKGKKKRVKQTFHGIIDRVDKSDSEDDEINSEHFSTPIPFEKKDYVAKILPIARSRESSPDNSLYPEISSIISRYRRSVLGAPIRSEDGRASVINEGAPVRFEDGRDSVTNEGVSLRSEDGRDSVTNEGALLRSDDGRDSATTEGTPLRSEDGRDSVTNENTPLHKDSIGHKSLREESIGGNSQQEGSTGEDATKVTIEESQATEGNDSILNNEGSSSSEGTLGNQPTLHNEITLCNEVTSTNEATLSSEGISGSEGTSRNKGIDDDRAANNFPLPVSSSPIMVSERKRSILVSSLDASDISFAKIPKIILIDCMKYKSLNSQSVYK